MCVHAYIEGVVCLVFLDSVLEGGLPSLSVCPMCLAVCLCVLVLFSCPSLCGFVVPGALSSALLVLAVLCRFWFWLCLTASATWLHLQCKLHHCSHCGNVSQHSNLLAFLGDA